MEQKKQQHLQIFDRAERDKHAGIGFRAQKDPQVSQNWRFVMDFYLQNNGFCDFRAKIFKKKLRNENFTSIRARFWKSETKTMMSGYAKSGGEKLSALQIRLLSWHAQLPRWRAGSIILCWGLCSGTLSEHINCLCSVRVPEHIGVDGVAVYTRKPRIILLWGLLGWGSGRNDNLTFFVQTSNSWCACNYAINYKNNWFIIKNTIFVNPSVE